MTKNTTKTAVVAAGTMLDILRLIAELRPPPENGDLSVVRR